MTKIEAQISSASTGYIRPPSSATLGELLDLFIDQTPAKGRTRASCLARLRERLGAVKLVNLSPVHLHDFLDRRVAEGAGGVTISQDLSYLASVLDWGRHVRQLDVSGNIARDARRALSHRGLKTRSTGRERLPTDAELRCLFDHWNSQQNRVIPMELITRFAIASAMRQSEITRSGAAMVP